MNAEAIADNQNCRITLYVVDWVIIQSVCLCCLKPGVPVLDVHVFGRRNDKKVVLCIFEKGKIKQSVNPRIIFTASILCLSVSLGPYLFLTKSKGCDRAMQRRRNQNLRWPKWLTFHFYIISKFRVLNYEFRNSNYEFRNSEL